MYMYIKNHLHFTNTLVIKIFYKKVITHILYMHM